MRPRSRAALSQSADLHIHTTHSDGSCSPCEVVRAAAQLGLRALAITDHDTLSAVAIARPEAERAGVELIAGVELTASYHGRELHILGHFVRDDDPALVEATAALRASRVRRCHEMVARLAELGLSIDLDVVSRAYPRATLGRRHLADYLVKSGQVADRRLVFARYLGDHGPVQVAKLRLDWDRAIALIRGAGGVAALAHPPYDLKMSALGELVGGGLSALEVAWPGLAPNKARRWRDTADRLGLVPTAGSDFHTPDRPGRWLGAVTTPLADLERLRQACQASPNPHS